MPQPAGLPHPSPDYDRTLVLAIELSSKSWVLAAQVPGLAQVKAKRTIEPTKEALLEALASYRARAAAAGHQIERVVSIYEAGWSGFWLSLAHHARRSGSRRAALQCTDRSADASG